MFDHDLSTDDLDTAPDATLFAAEEGLLKARCVLSKHLIARGRDGEVDGGLALVMTAGFAERIGDVIVETFQLDGYERSISIEADDFVVVITVNIGGYLTRTCIDIDGTGDFKIRRRLGGHKSTHNPADSGRALINVIKDTCLRYFADA